MAILPSSSMNAKRKKVKNVEILYQGSTDRFLACGRFGACWFNYAITFFVFSFGSSLLIFIIIVIPAKITVVTWLKLKLVKISVKYGKKSKRGQTRSVISVRFHLISVNFASEIKTYNTRSSFQIQIAC